MTLNELLLERGKVYDQLKELQDKYNNKPMDSADADTYGNLEKTFDDLTAKIEAEKRKLARERAMGEKPAAPQREQTGRASNEYRDAFWNAMRGRPVISNALQIGTDSEGGYLVPDEFERSLIVKLEEASVIRQLARKISTGSGDRIIPIMSSRGAAAWTGEEAAYGESDDAFAEIRLGAHKLTRIEKISEELLNDSGINMGVQVAESFAQAFATAEETAFCTGNGTGKPSGLCAASGGAATGVTAASATEITADELIDLMHAVKGPYRAKGTWVIADATLALIRKLKNSDGQYIWQPSFVSGEPDKIMGKPVFTSPAMPTVQASAKAVLFGDFNYYVIGDRAGYAMRRLNELYAANGQVGFIASKRLDAKLALSEAIKCMVMSA